MKFFDTVEMVEGQGKGVRKGRQR